MECTVSLRRFGCASDDRLFLVSRSTVSSSVTVQSSTANPYDREGTAYELIAEMVFRLFSSLLSSILRRLKYSFLRAVLVFLSVN